MSPETAQILRYTYAALALIASTGFVATLVVRWHVLRRGERILRAALIGEHATIVYAAYTAIKLDFPPTIVGAALTFWLFGIIVGFAVWISDDIIPGRLDPQRLTDRT